MVLDYINMMDRFLDLNIIWKKREGEMLFVPNQTSTNIPMALVTLTNIRESSWRDVKSLNFALGFVGDEIEYCGSRRKTLSEWNFVQHHAEIAVLLLKYHHIPMDFEESLKIESK